MPGIFEKLGNYMTRRLQACARAKRGGDTFSILSIKISGCALLSYKNISNSGTRSNRTHVYVNVFVSLVISEVSPTYYDTSYTYTHTYIHIKREREERRVVFAACLHYEIRLSAASVHFVHADVPAADPGNRGMQISPFGLSSRRQVPRSDGTVRPRLLFAPCIIGSTGTTAAS